MLIVSKGSALGLWLHAWIRLFATLLAFLADARLRHGRATRRRRVVARAAGRLLAADEAPNLFTRKGFIFEKSLGNSNPTIVMLGQDFPRLVIRLFDQTTNLVIDLLLRFLRQVLRACNRMAQENLFLVVAIGNLPELVGEAPTGNHRAGKLGGLLDVRSGTRGDVLLAELHLFRNASAHHDGQAGYHPLVAHGVAVAFRQLHDHAERTSARND